eukprot:TRINITY_DN3219_c2_g2_i1.p1 TRINITY_DN3219_c2_g2~~TRINITY_DN3219_c2_g2_i1.p1  ORF type:complete len:206 (+),score=31.04 TRINITY_DN3219_c2_g2_i1:72-689(+)
MRSLLVLAGFGCLACGVHAIEVCGNYCGPEWCNGKEIRERDCDESVAPTGQADSCCKEHDRCCGQADKSSCNRDLVTCLHQVNPADMDCTRPGGFIPFPVPVPPQVIEKSMEVVEDWCCGEPCPTTDHASPAMSIAGDALSLDAVQNNSPVAVSSEVPVEAPREREGMTVTFILFAIVASLSAFLVRRLAVRRQEPNDDVYLAVE